MRVIDGESNKQLGILPTPEAIKIAKSKGLDLVEITASADPPICKICDYGKHKYDEAKQKKERNKTKVATRIKEVKFRVRIDDHDYRIKMEHAEDFLAGGHKLRVQLQFRGREMAHQELGMQMMARVKEDLKTMGHVDMEPRKAGRNISMMLSPLPAQKRVRKFKSESSGEEDYEGEDGEEEDVESSASLGEEAVDKE